VREPSTITVGPDHELWFTNRNGRLGRITTAGDITTYTAAHGRTHGLVGIATGPDGHIWFTSTTTNRIGYLRPSGAPTRQTADAGGPH
jgi:virginiamycin B lyase